MKNTIAAMAALSLAIGMSACTGETEDANSLAGTWKADLDSASWENTVDTYVVADGEFTCESCLPPYTASADGEWQEIDRPGYDGLRIELVDDNTLTTANRLGDKDLGNSTWTVSEDGQSMTIAWNDLDGDVPVEGSTSYTRTAEGAEGSHAVSGSWTVAEIDQMSDEALTFSFVIDGDQYTSKGNSGDFTATIGGDAVAIEGDNSGVMVAVVQLEDGSYRETYSRDGETIGVTELTVDGDTLSGIGSDPRDDSMVRWTATRQ